MFRPLVFPSFGVRPSATLPPMEKMVIAAFSLGLTWSVLGQSLLDDSQYKGLQAALGKMEMSVGDLQFHKDVGEPDVRFQWSREWLHDPLLFPAKVGELTAGLKNGHSLQFEFISEMMEAPPRPLELPPAPASLQWPGWPDGKFPELADAVKAFLDEAHHASCLLAAAFESVDESDRRYLAMSLFAGELNAEDREEIRAELLSLPVSKQELQGLMAEQKHIDPSPSVNRSLDAIQAIDLSYLLQAAEIWIRELRALQERTSALEEWPSERRSLETELGSILIGTEENDFYEAPAMLILDPSGDDVYQSLSGTANGLNGHPLAGIIDLKGRDTYRSDSLLGPGSALFGLSAIVDLSGNDAYEMKFVGPAAGLFGVGWVEDAAGNDRYKAEGLGQAAGHAGIGVLDDGGGNDVYEIGYSGQGYAGVQGFGLLVDRAGNDRYLAGGVRPDYERHDDHYLTLAQGFSIGSRPHAGGGFAALIDQGGNDSYVADVYGQGVGYWYAAGALVDESGNDTYQLHQYGQGAGIHLSLGLLADHAGNDRYTGYVLTQGSAHDYGVGILLEGEGEDTYTADHYSQGRAMYNAFAMLIDSAGNDAYFSRQCERSQGIGHDGDTREYGSLALLIDLAGEDQYNCGGADGEAVQRPDFGIIYDFGEEMTE